MTPEEKREYMRVWRNKNKDKLKAYQVEYQAAHRAEINANARRYRKYGRKRPFEPKAYDSVTGEEIKL